MLFLVVSEPRPEPPTAIASQRARFWIEPDSARRFLAGQQAGGDRPE